MRPERRPVWIFFLLVLTCLVMVVSARYRTDMAAFLPAPNNLGQAALLAQVSGEGAASRLTLVALDGGSAEQLAQASQQIARTLRRDPAFDAILNGDESSIDPIRHFVWDNRFLLDPTLAPDRFSAAALRQSLVSDLSLLTSDLAPMMEQTLPGDPIGSVISVSESLRQGQGAGPRLSHGVWMTPDGHEAMLILYTHAPGFDLDAQETAQRHLNDAFAHAIATLDHTAHLRIRMTGPGVFAVASRDTTKHDVSLLSAIASTGAILFLILAYRSVVTLVLGLLPVLGAVLFGIASVSLGFGYVHAITLGFGVTLLGEAMDYSIYLLTQNDPAEGPQRTARRLWPTLRLGALVSIVGFGAMLGSDFTGFAQLGLFSMTGLAAAVLTARFVLPGLVPGGFKARGALAIGRPIEVVRRHQPMARMVLGLATCLALTSIALHEGSLWQQDLLSMSPLPAETQRLDTTLRQELGLINPQKFLAWRAENQETALQIGEKLQASLETLVKEGKIESFLLPGAILPSETMQAYRRASLPDQPTLQANLTQASAGLPFEPDSFSPFVADIARARQAVPMTRESLPPLLSLRLNSILTSGSKMGWIVLAPIEHLSDERAVQAVLPEEVEIVDLDKQSTGLLKHFQHEAVTLAVVGTLGVIALILGFLRNLARTAKIVLPLLGAVTVTAGILVSTQGQMSIFMIAGFLLIMAVGSNYGLFFAERHEHRETRKQTLASIMLANLCTVAAYGVLSFSSIPVLHDIGMTVAIGTFLCLVFGAAFTAERDA